MSPTMLDDGVYPAVERDRYDTIARVNFSKLKWMARSPAHYRHALTEPYDDTDAKKVGRVVHVAAFEPERFLNSIAVWDGGTRRGKDWDAFRERNEGKELLTVNEHERCKAIQAAVRADATAMRYVTKGKGEVSMLWSSFVGEEAIACKGRIDFDAVEALADLKTTRDASPATFGRQAFALHYHTQAAWYVDGYERATGIRKPYVIVAVESEAPYVVQTYRVPDHYLELGRIEYRGWLDTLSFCGAQSYWPAYSDGSELELELPRWAMPTDEDLAGEGLTSGGKPLTMGG
jgi:hypothetical protein